MGLSHSGNLSVVMTMKAVIIHSLGCNFWEVIYILVKSVS